MKLKLILTGGVVRMLYELMVSEQYPKAFGLKVMNSE
jgi:hypothetical protein